MNRRIRESLVALFVLGGIALAVFTFYWFSGRLHGGNRRVVTVYFRDAVGLKVGDPADVLGINKGRVTSLELEGNRVKVQVAMNRDLVLAEDTRFAIRSVSYLGSDRYLMVIPGTGKEAGLDYPFEGRNEALDLEETFLRLDALLNNVKPSMITNELARVRDELMATIRSQLTDFNTSFGNAADGLVRLSARLDTLLQQVNVESTAGKLVQSAELYEEVRQTNAQLQALLADIKQHPERYVKVRFSLFR